MSTGPLMHVKIPLTHLTHSHTPTLPQHPSLQFFFFFFKSFPDLSLRPLLLDTVMIAIIYDPLHLPHQRRSFTVASVLIPPSLSLRCLTKVYLFSQCSKFYPPLPHPLPSNRCHAETLTSRSAMVPFAGGSAGVGLVVGGAKTGGARTGRASGAGLEAQGRAAATVEVVVAAAALVWKRICCSVRRRLGCRRACVW